MRNIIIVALITIFFSGCSFRSHYIDLKPNTKMRFSNIQLSIPSSFPQYPWLAKSVNSDSFFRSIPNVMSEDVTIWVENLDPKRNRRLLVKKTNHEYEKTVKSWGRQSDWAIQNNYETKKNYKKNYVDYVGGLKCGTTVESRSYIPGVGRKLYSTNCYYYDKEGKDKWMHIRASLQTWLSSEEFKDFINPEDLVRQKNKLIEIQFKKDMKEIFDSIVIHDMDVKKMEEEELLYDRKYDINNEDKAVDRSMECKAVDKDRAPRVPWIFKCVGRETKEVVMCTSIYEKGKARRWECK